jgi:hypothetical protein
MLKIIGPYFVQVISPQAIRPSAFRLAELEPLVSLQSKYLIEIRAQGFSSYHRLAGLGVAPVRRSSGEGGDAVRSDLGNASAITTPFSVHYPLKRGNRIVKSEIRIITQLLFTKELLSNQ